MTTIIIKFMDDLKAQAAAIHPTQAQGQSQATSQSQPSQVPPDRPEEDPQLTPAEQARLFFPVAKHGEDVIRFLTHNQPRKDAMVDRLLDLTADKSWATMALRLFYEDEILADLDYPRSW